MIWTALGFKPRIFFLPVHNGFLRIISCATSADLLTGNMAVDYISYTYLAEVGCFGWNGLFFLKFLEDINPFVGPLIPLFWTSGDVCPGF